MEVTRRHRRGFTVTELVLVMGIMVVLVVAAMAATSAAADSSWIAPKDGLFADPGRWSNGVPGLGATAIFGVMPGGPFTVTTAGTQVVGGLSVTNQLVTLDAAGGTPGSGS